MSLHIGIPESTIIITLTAIGLAVLSNIAVRLLVDLNKERRLRREVSAFDKELRAATLKKDKAKEEKLKKLKPQYDKMRLSMSTGRLKATVVTYIPFLLVYYSMANLVFSGIGTQVAMSPIPIPYLVSSSGGMALFWWYSLSSFSFSFVLQKLLGTSITT
ncbi:MAG: EMC3/TMCO1 family protein [Thaumarchaeota archaeon]|nr:EMC3/TMCO1 family protein [Nitrososphaerota archaeon]MDA4135655.1 EMC3/TMCO1 family protein [Nitrososphaerota archaeon]